MPTTEIGKELRRIRINHDERLYDMAEKLERSAAFVSSVETGRKSPPAHFEDLVIKAYRLVGHAADAMRKAADRSRDAFTLEAETDLQRDTFGQMARRMKSLSDEELQEIFSILKQEDRKQNVD